MSLPVDHQRVTWNYLQYEPITSKMPLPLQLWMGSSNAGARTGELRYIPANLVPEFFDGAVWIPLLTAATFQEVQVIPTNFLYGATPVPVNITATRTGRDVTLSIGAFSHNEAGAVAAEFVLTGGVLPAQFRPIATHRVIASGTDNGNSVILTTDVAPNGDITVGRDLARLVFTGAPGVKGSNVAYSLSFLGPP